MKHLISLSLLLLVGVLTSAYLLPSVDAAAPASDVQAQITPGITLVPPVGTPSTPVIVVPVTGDPSSSTLLFYGILVLAGLAFVIMLFALMRRPTEPHDHTHDHE